MFYLIGVLSVLLVEPPNLSFNSDCDLLITADVALACWPPVPPPPDELTYHDGNPFWLSWSGRYRATWFSTFDFTTTCLGCTIEGAELWFYHHIEYPWDTSDFYLELWEGDIDHPTSQLESNLLVASHYAPVMHSFSSSPMVDYCFWIIVNTELSTGGWPSNLVDSGSNFTGETRSFVTDDEQFFIWEPWTSDEECTFLVPIERNSWGRLKTIFN